MAEIKYKFDYTDPQNVECQVPGEQTIREGLPDSATEWDEDKIETPEDYTLSPVVTITKNEATFTKGDMKLQKVSVTENISEIRNGVFHTIKAPSYPLIHSDVIHDTPIRMDRSSQSEASDRGSRPTRRLETQTSQPEERRTRIPTRFKNAVNRMRRERSMPAKNFNETPPAHPRRSSIPKLKPRSPPPKLEDEFERLFGDIANSPTDLDISLLNNKVDDPEQVEDCFEEIIHAYDENNIHSIAVETPKQYDENKVQPVTVEKPKSKIPMFKRKSEPEIEIPKSVQATNKIASDKHRFKDAVTKVSKTNTIESKLPSKIAVTKKVNVDSDNSKLKTSYQRIRSISRDGQSNEVHIVKFSLEQDISPYNVVTIDNVGASEASESTVEITEITPVDETADFANEITVQPYSIEVLESPISTVVEDLQNNVIEIEETTENERNPEVVKADISKVQTQTPIDPVKVISVQEFHNVLSKNWEDSDKFKPVVDVNRNGTAFSNDNNISNLAKEKFSTEREKVYKTKYPKVDKNIHDYGSDEKKIQLRRTVRLDSKKETNEEEDNAVQHKSVLSKIAMFEKHRQDDKKHVGLRPKPAVRCSYRRKIAEEEAVEPERNIPITNISQEYVTDDVSDENKPKPTSKIPEPEFRHTETESNTTHPKISKDDVTDDALDRTIPTLPTSKIPEPEISHKKLESFTKNPKISKDDVTNDTILNITKTKLLTSKIPEPEIRYKEPESNPTNPKISNNDVIDDVLDITKTKLPTSEVLESKIRHNGPGSYTKNPEISNDVVADDALDRAIPKLPISKVLEPEIRHNKPESYTGNPTISKDNVADDALDITKPNLPTSKIPEQEIRLINIDSKPIIVSEVIKPVEPNAYSNNINNDTYPVKIEVNNVVKPESIRLSTMEFRTEEVPVSNAVEEILFEKQTTVSEIQGAVINCDKTERIKRHNPNRYYSFEVDYSQENPGNAEKANEIEIKSLTPMEIEYSEAINSNILYEVKGNDFKAQDPVVINKIYEKPKMDSARKDPKESPFDFTVRNRGNESRNHTIKPLMSTEEILNAYRAKNEEYNLRKAKSVAELDLGDAVKGKVHNLIVRMTSVYRSVGKKEVISVKERPRKKSVSEKIALFEGVFSQATGRYVYNHSIREEQKRAEEVQARSEEEYQKHLEELTASKQTYGQATTMPKVVLNNGEEMPVIAIGTALLDKRLAPNIVSTAIELGYRAIDTAFIYGNEKEVGEGIKKKIDDGTVKRQDLFVIAKLWSTFHRRDLVELACRQSLENLGLDYVDLYLIHNPMSFKEGSNPVPMIAKVVQYSEHDYLDAWYGMEELVTKGLVKSIGLSNFNSSQVQKVLDKARVKPAVNQVECHPYLSQHRLYNFCEERSIKLSCFGVLGSKGTPAEYKNTTVAAIDDPMVQVMAAGLNVTPAQLLIRYQLQSDHAVVVKASTGAHMWDNLQALNIELTEVQMDALRALNRNKRIFAYKGMGDTHKNYPFNAAF